MKRKNYKIISMLLLVLLITQCISFRVYAEGNDSESESEPTTDYSTAYSTDVAAPNPEQQPSQEDKNPSGDPPAPETPAPIPVDPEIGAVEEKVESLEGKVEQLEEVIEGVKDKDTNGVNEDGGAPASQEAINKTLDDIDGVNSTNIADAKQDLSEMKEHLDEANKQENDVNTNLGPAVDAAVAVDAKANEIESDVNKLSEEVNALIKDIESANTPKEINDLYDELTTKVDNAGLSLEDKKKAFTTLQEAYEKVIKKAEDANTLMNSEIGKAKDNADDLEQKLSDLDTEITTLKTSTNIATGKLEDDADNASDLQYDIDHVGGNGKWEKLRNKMYIIIEGFYLPQYVDPDATDVTFEFVRGYETQDTNYNIITYKDKTGETHTLYFNYDLTDKEVKEGNPWYHIGTKNTIVIYPVTKEEVEANAHLSEYYGKKQISNQSEAKNGKLDVFTYTVNDQPVYLCREELEKAVIEGNATKDDNGNYIINGTTLRKVVFNQNSKANGGNNYLDETTDEEYLNFLKNSDDLYQKFLAYESKVNDAKELVDTAKQEAGTLKEAVDTLKTSKENLSVLSILSDKEVEELSSVMTEEELANLETMTVKEAIKFLNDLVEKAKKKVENAVINYNVVKKQYDDITEKLDDMIADVTPQPSTGGGTTTDTPSGDAPAVTTDTTTAVITPLTNPAVVANLTPAAATLLPNIPAFANVNTNLLNTTNDNTQPQVNIDDGLTPLSDTPNANIEDGKTPLSDKPSSTTISDQETPLSATPEKNVEANYWWLLALIILAIVIMNHLIYKKMRENSEKA